MRAPCPRAQRMSVAYTGRHASLCPPCVSVTSLALHLSALADGAEMLVDAEHDQHELGDDAGEDHADDHPDQAGNNIEQAGERTERHQRQAGYDAGKAEQQCDAEREPIEYLD